MTVLKMTCLAVAVMLGGASGALAIDEDAQIKLGKSEFMASCAACHGVDGKGSGPVAEVMVNKPLDLTQIKKKYGTFPADEMYRVIDGRKMINPHGSRDMPVWGYRYLAQAIERSNEVPHDVDKQAMVFGRITALVNYLGTIQAE